MGRNAMQTFVWCHFCLVKAALQKFIPILSPRRFPHLIILNLFSVLFTIVLFLTLLPSFFLLLTIYKYLTILILTLIHGKSFHGLITGSDEVTMLREEDGFAINAVLCVETGSDVREFFANLKREVWEGLRGLEGGGRFFSVRERFMGFVYCREVEGVRPEEVFVEVEGEEFEVLGEEEIVGFLTRHCVDFRLPRKNKFNWDLIYAASGVRTRDNLKQKLFFVLRIHHCLVDGLTLYNLIKTLLTKSAVKQSTYVKNLIKTKTSRNPLPWRFDPRTPAEPLKTLPQNSATSQKLSCKIERSANLVRKIKEIKSQNPKLSFNSVVFAAYSAALGEFFAKICGNSVETVTVSVPVQVGTDRFVKYFLETSVGLGNDYAVFDIDLPVVPKGKQGLAVDSYILERLELVNQEFLNVEKYINLQFNYMFTTTYLELLPWPIASQMAQAGNYSVVASCFPGGPTMELFNGDKLTELCFVLPLLPTKCGLGVFLCTYDGRFQAMQLADLRRFEEGAAEHLDEVLGDFFKYLDVLHAKICQK